MSEDRPNKVKDSAGRTIKAGGIVVREEKGQKYILIVYRPKLKDCVFPKGHQEPGETVEETAIREIEEETSAKVSDGQELPNFEYINKNNPEGIIVKMYLFKTNQKELASREISSKPQWLPIDQVGEQLSYQNLKDYFNLIKNKI